MPSHRVTDAANIAPYLTHAVSHCGQVTLVPPDNSSRVRQAQPKKSRNQRQERNIKPEEDVRFNTGPRPLRNLISNRAGRRLGRQDRGRDEDHGDDGKPPARRVSLMIVQSQSPKAYPDYPPPSFLEATSTFSGPESSNGATLPAGAVSQPMSPVTPSNNGPSIRPVPASASSYLNQHQPSPQVSDPRSAGDDADSDTSLEIIDMEFLPSGIRLEEEVKRDWINRRGVEFPTPSENLRGRTKSRGRTNSDTEDIPGESQANPSQEVVKRRPMSLSPLRTFFPYRPMAVHDGAFSASPNASPYSSRSSLPFLSTTSLKMSLSTTSFVSSVKGENFLSRKLLSFKGKERVSSNESLDNWEVVDPESSGSTSTPKLIENPSSPLQSPTVSQSFPTETRGVPGYPTQEVNTVHTVDQSVDTSPHPLSLRDRKAPVVPFPSRPRRRAPHPPAPVVNLANIPQGPVVVSVRTRKPPPPPPPPKRPQVINTSPLGFDSRCESSTELDPDSNTILQRALATPLPASPIDAHYVYSSPKIANLNAKNVSVLVHPTATVDIPISTPALEITGRTSNLDALKFVGSMVSGDRLSRKQTAPGDDPSSNVRHHYPGRPLPQPPSTAQASADTTVADHENSMISVESQTSSRCPEGLLIDLEDNSVVEAPVGSNSTIWLNDRRPTTPSYAATSSRSSIDLLGSIADAAVPPQDGTLNGLASPTHSTVPFSQITDLDVLASHIDEGVRRQGGSDYGALLSLSEFITPATPTSTSIPQPSDSSPAISKAAPGTAALAPNVPLLGNVQLERRRTTKDGRVKLKLSLIDAPIDKCGICLTQFRGGDAAQLGSTCRHAFHEKCLVKWLARSKTCPMCRVPLADQP